MIDQPPAASFASLAEMITPRTLGRLLGRPVSAVAVEVVEPFSSTQGEFGRVTLDGDSRRSLFYKVARPATDWVALATADQDTRAVTAWESGLLMRMPKEVDPAVIACSRGADEYAILMPDLGRVMLPEGVPMEASAHAAILDALAAMHAAFWEDAALDDPALGLCTPRRFMTHLSPWLFGTLRAELDSFVYDLAVEGWETLPLHIDARLAADVRALVDDPRPLVEALEHYPRTLCHTDYRPANVGLSRKRNVVHVIDWARLCATTCTVDLGYYLSWTPVERPGTIDEAVARYASGLATRLPRVVERSGWARQRDLGLLAGFLGSGAFLALGAAEDDAIGAAKRRSLEEWAPILRRALQQL